MKFKSILFLVAIAAFLALVATAVKPAAIVVGAFLLLLALTAINLGDVYRTGHCYANTLTNLIPTLVKGFDVVSRELVGFLPSVNRDPSTDRLAKNQTLYSWRTPSASLSTITPANVSPSAADKVLSNISIVIDNFKMSDFYFTGEEEKSLGGNYGNIVTDMIEQAIRAVVNQMESDLALAAAVGASRAYGTVAAVPFGTNVGESAQLKKILDDNGAPSSLRSLIIDTSTGASLRTLQNLTRVNEAGTGMTLRDGELLNLNGLSIKESAQVNQFTAGTMANATTDNAGYAVGATVLVLATAGTGVVAAGDIVTFAGDTNKYVVSAVSFAGANPAAADTITIAAPGLRKAMSAATKAITVVGTGSSTARSCAFSKNAILLATRLPARPSGGDMASDVQVITDARSGMSIEVSMYPQYRQVRYEVAAAWGVKIIKPEHIAQLIW